MYTCMHARHTWYINIYVLLYCCRNICKPSWMDDLCILRTPTTSAVVENITLKMFDWKFAHLKRESTIVCNRPWQIIHLILPHKIQLIIYTYTQTTNIRQWWLNNSSEWVRIYSNCNYLQRCYLEMFSWQTCGAQRMWRYIILAHWLTV